MLTKEQALQNLGLENVTLREQAERLWLAHRDAYAAYSQKWDAVRDELENEIDDDPRVAPLKVLADQTGDAWKAFEAIGEPITTTVHDGDGEREIPVRCQLSGVIMTIDDDVLCDAYGNAVMLRAAAGLPSESEMDDAQSEAA